MIGTGRNRGWLAGAAISVALVTGACGSSDNGDNTARAVASLEEPAAPAADTDSSDDSSSEPSEDISPEEAEAAGLRYEQCMLENGVDLSELEETGSQTSFDSDEEFEAQQRLFESFEAAQEVCDPILEEVFGDFELNAEQEAELADLEAEFNQCLAAAGFEIGDNGEIVGLGLDDDTTELDSAFEECNSIFEQSAVFGAESDE